MTFLSAMLLGLLASAHCAGMCGGLQSVLQQSQVIRSKRQIFIHLVVLNIGRLSVYVLFGFLVGSLGTEILEVVDIPQLTRSARYITSVLLIVLGLQLIIAKAKPFERIERIGICIWNFVSRYQPKVNQSSIGTSYRRGLIWGFLPCGLVYGVLLTTLFSNNGWQGAITLLGFGLGTLPALLLTGSLYQQLRVLVRSRYTQFFGGAIFIQGGLLMLLAPLFTNLDFMQTYPQLMLTMFCVS